MNKNRNEKTGRFEKETKITKAELLEKVESDPIYSNNVFELYDFSKGINILNIKAQKVNIIKTLQKITLLKKLVILQDKKEIVLKEVTRFAWGCVRHLDHIELYLFGHYVQENLKVLKLDDRYTIESWRDLSIYDKLIIIENALKDCIAEIDVRLTWFSEMI